MSNQEGKKKNKKTPPLQGIAIAAILWLWGTLFLYAPGYIGFSGTLQTIFNLIGIILIIISLVGALIELGKLWDNEALSYWGISLVFLVPAGLLHIAQITYDFYNPWDVILKASILLLIFVGGPFVFIGVPYVFWKSRKEELPEITEEELKIRKSKNREKKLDLIFTLCIALLSLTTAIITFVSEFVKLR